MTTQTTDEQTLQALFSRFLAGWNAGDGEAFAAPFTERVEFIGFDGTHFSDRSELAAFHQELFDKWLKGTRLVGDAEVRFLSPDVALLTGRGGTIMRGKSAPDRVRDSIQTLTAVRQPDGEWRFTSFQNTRRRPMGSNPLLWLCTDLLWRVFGRRTR
jgi:uncharacterized protein (TIGR02246 family)